MKHPEQRWSAERLLEHDWLKDFKQDPLSLSTGGASL